MTQFSSSKNQSPSFKIDIDRLEPFSLGLIERIDTFLDASCLNNQARHIYFHLKNSSPEEQFVTQTHIFSDERLKDNLKSFQQLIKRIRSLSHTSIVILEGPCTERWLEFALACQYRIALDDKNTIFALRYARLGLVPHGGASITLTRLMGSSRTLDFLLTGRVIDCKKALKYGIIHQIMPSHLQDHDTINQIRKRLESDLTLSAKATSRWDFESTPILKKVVEKRVRSMIELKTRGGNPSSYKVLDLVLAASEHSFEEHLEVEKKYFLKLHPGKFSRGLRHYNQLVEKFTQKPEQQERIFQRNERDGSLPR